MSMPQENATITTTCFLNWGNVLPFSKTNEHHSIGSRIPYIVAKDKISCSQL